MCLYFYLCVYVFVCVCLCVLCVLDIAKYYLLLSRDDLHSSSCTCYVFTLVELIDSVHSIHYIWIIKIFCIRSVAPGDVGVGGRKDQQ